MLSLSITTLKYQGAWRRLIGWGEIGKYHTVMARSNKRHGDGLSHASCKMQDTSWQCLMSNREGKEGNYLRLTRSDFIVILYVGSS